MKTYEGKVCKELIPSLPLHFFFSRTSNEKAWVKPDPTEEERPEWTTVWIKREEEDNDFKVDVQDEAMEAEDRASANFHGSSGLVP